MELNFKPKTELEKFGAKIYFLLVENFSSTYIVGGAVRDILLRKEIRDMDFATSAVPEMVINVLKNNGIDYDGQYKKLGIVIILWNHVHVSVSTFRNEEYFGSRYPKVTFGQSIKQDAKRRDFTINSLYLSMKDNKILDFNTGLKDIKAKRLKFIGNPEKRITEDPLRILRALRFALVLNFRLDNKTLFAIKNNFNLIKKLTESKIKKEILKIKNKKQQTILKSILINPELLDKYFK